MNSNWECVFYGLTFLPAIVGIAWLGMQKKVLMRHSESGLTKDGYVGWSLTYYAFGCCVPFYRGEVGIGILHLILTCITLGFFQCVMSCFYNKQYMDRMFASGWVLSDTAANNDYARLKLGIH